VTRSTTILFLLAPGAADIGNTSALCIVYGILTCVEPGFDSR
jgi:hypothetical protein